MRRLSRRSDARRRGCGANQNPRASPRPQSVHFGQGVRFRHWPTASCCGQGREENDERARAGPTAAHPLQHPLPHLIPSSSRSHAAMDDSMDASSSAVLSRLTLDLRGTRFVIERETLMHLPESVLLCLFPNGLVLTRQNQGLGALDDADDEEEEEVYIVDVSTCASSWMYAHPQAHPLCYSSPSSTLNASRTSSPSSRLPKRTSMAHPLAPASTVVCARSHPRTSMTQTTASWAQEAD